MVRVVSMVSMPVFSVMLKAVVNRIWTILIINPEIAQPFKNSIIEIGYVTVTG